MDEDLSDYKDIQKRRDKGKIEIEREREERDVQKKV
jgi:hypothetical protein